jgi:hypothetical protein
MNDYDVIVSGRGAPGDNTSVCHEAQTHGKEAL